MPGGEGPGLVKPATALRKARLIAAGMTAKRWCTGMTRETATEKPATVPSLLEPVAGRSFIFPIQGSSTIDDFVESLSSSAPRYGN